MRERGDASVREGKRGSLRLRGAWGHVEREKEGKSTREQCEGRNENFNIRGIQT